MLCICTWLLVKTLKMCNSESGAKPWHSLMLAITPATKVPWPKPINTRNRQFMCTCNIQTFTETKLKYTVSSLLFLYYIGGLPSSSVFSLVQLVLSLTFLKCGCFSLSPVSNTATLTPEPTKKPGIIMKMNSDLDTKTAVSKPHGLHFYWFSLQFSPFRGLLLCNKTNNDIYLSMDILTVNISHLIFYTLQF